MWRAVVCGLLLFVGVCRSALATDYDLTIDPSSKGLLKEHTITLYQPFGLVKSGDRIVSITVGRLPSPNIACRVWGGTGEGSVVLDSKGSLRNFEGEIRLGSGNPGTNGVAAALLMHTISDASSNEGSGFFQIAASFLASHPLIWIGFGAMILLGVILAILRLNSPAPGTVPLYGKRAYEENIREVKDKLERVLEAQELLVRKPPVLRSFRKQIDRFDRRLEKLEVTSVSTQQAVSVLATTLVDLEKYLDLLTEKHDGTANLLENLGNRVAAQGEDAKKSIANLKDSAERQTEHLQESLNSLSTQLDSQTNRLDETAKALENEIRHNAKLADEAAKHLAEQQSAHKEVALAATASLQSELSALREAVAGADREIAAVRSSLSNAQNADVARAEETKQAFGKLLDQFNSLAPLPANVSDLHGRVGNLRTELAALTEKLSAATTELGEFQRTSVLSFAGMEERITELRGAMADFGSEVSKLHSEVEVSRSVTEANSSTVVDMSKRVEEVTSAIDTFKKGAATREQVDNLSGVPKAIEALKEALSGMDSRLGEAGISKADGEKILLAHEKLDALSSDVSQAVQKALEQRLATLMAQSLATKKGKDSEGSGVSDRGAAALAEVAQQLVAEIEQHKNLEQGLAKMLARIEEIPTALQRIDEKIVPSAPAPEPQVIPVEQILSMIADTKRAVDEMPERIAELEKSLASASAKWEAAENLIAKTAEEIAELAARPPQIVAQTSAPAVAQPEVKAAAGDPKPKAAPKEPAAQELPPVGPTEATPNPSASSEVLQVLESIPAKADVTAENASQADIQVEEIGDPAWEESVPAAEVKRSAKRPVAASSGAEDWISASGNLQGTWSTYSPQRLCLSQDAESAKHALTPTETPGIEYQIGPMISCQNRIVYAHGDSLRIFWPGINERSILLANSVPSESWRMLLFQQRLFCAEEKRVEIIDASSWTKSAFFAGEYVGQTACLAGWAGVKAGARPVLEFRDMMGEPLGNPSDLDKHYLDCLPLVSNGSQVFVPCKNGKVLKATPQANEMFCDLSGSKNTLVHFAITEYGPVALVADGTGLSIKLLNEGGSVAETCAVSAANSSGNVVVAGACLAFFDPGSQKLHICDLENMRMEAPIELPGVQRVRKLAAFQSPDSVTLLVAACDTAGKLGNVFLLDAEDRRQVPLCSTNQPHVDAIFGAGHAIVATSSSYQNIIRVFQPFDNAEKSGRAA